MRKCPQGQEQKEVCCPGRTSYRGHIKKGLLQRDWGCLCCRAKKEAPVAFSRPQARVWKLRQHMIKSDIIILLQRNAQMDSRPAAFSWVRLPEQRPLKCLILFLTHLFLFFHRTRKALNLYCTKLQRTRLHGCNTLSQAISRVLHYRFSVLSCTLRCLHEWHHSSYALTKSTKRNHWFIM